MTRPYSLDLRERVVRTVEAGVSRHATAARFDVSPSFVIKLLQRWRRRGTLEPDRIGGGKRPKLADHVERVHTLLAAAPDLTVAELQSRLAAEDIRVVSPSAISRFLAACGLTRKKRPRTPPSRTARTSPPPGSLARAATGAEGRAAG
jgi:transposase